MYSHNMAPGPVNTVNTLSQSDRFFCKKEVQNADVLYAAVAQADLPVCANFIQENMGILGQIVNVTSVQKSGTKSVTLNETTRQRFMNLLQRAIKAHEGLSRQERLFIHQFWSEIQHFYAAARDVRTVGALSNPK